MTGSSKGGTPVRKHSQPNRESERHPALFEERREAWLREKQLPFQRHSLFVQLAVFAALFVVWQLPIINPIKLLVVVFHEGAHVVAGYATGASIFGMAIDPGGAGVTLGIGGNSLIILAAGYVGSFLVGYALYALCAVWSPMEVWLVLTGLSAASLFMGWLNDFTQVFAYGSLVLLGLGALFFSDGTKLFLLRVIGTASCLYPVIDVAAELWSGGSEGFELHDRPIGSDALMISQVLGIPLGVTAVFFVLSGLVLVAYLITWSARVEARTQVRRSLVMRARQKERTIPRLYDPSDPSSIPEYTIR